MAKSLSAPNSPAENPPKIHPQDRRWRFFIRDQNGAAALTAAIALPALALGVAAAVDLAQMNRYKTALDTAADAAVLMAVSQGVYDPARDSASQKTISESAATKAFAVEASKMPSISWSVTYTAPSASTPASAELRYSGNIKSVFGNLGSSWLKVSGRSVANAAASGGSYTNLYILLDISGSMGLGVDLATQTAMKNDSAVGKCAFACHDPAFNTAVQARSKGYVLRFDAIKARIDTILSDLNKQFGASSSSPLRAAIYPFNSEFKQVSPLGPDMTAHRSALNALDFTLTNGGTSIRHALVELKKQIAPPGDGSSASKARAAVLLVTDGLADAMTYDAAGNWIIAATAYPPYSGTRCWNQAQPPKSGPYYPPSGAPENPMPCVADYVETPQKYQELQPINPAWCSELKSYGVRMLTMYSQYDLPKPPTDAWTWDTTQWRYPLIYYYLAPKIPAAMAACASTSSDAFTVFDTPTINAGVSSLFDKAIPKQATRLVK